MSTPTRPLPFVPLLALLLVGLAVAFLLSSETPRGRVTGVTVLRDAKGQPLAGCDVYLTPQDDEEHPAEPGIGLRDVRRSRHVETRGDGTFDIRGIPAGTYSLSASARRHSAESVTVNVEEAKTVDRKMVLTRTEPDLSIGAHQAAFGTAEKPFLPLKGYLNATGAGAKTANLAPDSLKVRVWKTRLSDILRREDTRTALNALRESGEESYKGMPGALLAAAPDVAAPALVYDASEPVVNADREGFFLNRVPLAQAAGKPGLYLAEFTYGKKTVCSYVVVSDMALVSKRAEGQVVAYAADIKTGKAIPGATVRFYRDGQVAATGTTGADGVSRLNPAPLSVPAKTGDEDAEEGAGEAVSEKNPLVAATRGADEAVVQGANWWYGGESRAFVVHTLTDRTIYRPGDTVNYKGIVRRTVEAGGEGNGYAVPRNEPVLVEVRDPEGALVVKTQTTTNAAGTFAGSVEISFEGDTGAYSIVATIAGQKHTSDVTVASYRKPEYTVTVTPAKSRYLRGDDVEMTVEGKYYFGAPVAGAKVKYFVYADADWTREYGLSGEEDPDDGEMEGSRGYGNYYGRSVAEGEAVLDASGKAIVRFSTKPEKKEKEKKRGDGDEVDVADADGGPQVEKFTLTATVVDDAKREVEAEGAASVTAADFRLNVQPEGYLAKPGRASTILVTARDFDGKPLPGKAVVVVAEYWTWDAKNKKRVKTTLPGIAPVTTGPDGRAVFNLTPTRNGELNLTATAADAGGRAAHDTAYLWVADDNGGDLDTDYNDLTLLTDKKRYEPGETARVLINAARVGQSVLLTVEGDRVYETRTVPVTQRSTVVNLPVRAEWGGNVTLAACYVRDKKFATSETPLRVVQKAREVKVAVKPDRETAGPGETLTYTVTTTDAATGKPVPSDFSLAVVDESIYALRADDPKALQAAFYPRRSNRVSTAYSFQVEYLGDADKSEPQIEARRKFRDTAFWAANLSTDATGQATVHVPLPDNLTTWRATAQAVTDRTAVGYGLSKVVSRKLFFVRLEMPRYLTVGDETRLLALAHNETGQPQQVTVRLTALNGGGQLTFGGGETRTLTVPAGGVGQAEWPVKVVAPGQALLRLTGWTPSGAGQYTDGVETALTIRAYGRTETNTLAGSLGKSDPVVASASAATGLSAAAPGRLTLTLDNAAVPQETRLTVRVTPSVRGALSGGLDYLIGFPYGCTEQTMSRFYPDLLAQRLNVPLKDAQAKNLPRMVRDGLSRLRRLQKYNTGGWGWFQNGPDDPFLTAYVLTGLAAARDGGYPVDEGMLKKGRDAAAKMQDSAPPRVKPFLLYSLAVAGETDLNRLRYPFKYSTVRTKLELEKLPPDALAYLVLLAKRIGEDYRPAWNELQRRAKVEGRLIHWTASSKGWDEYGSDRMATATALRALLAVDPKDARIPAVLRWLMGSRTDGYFGNTRDTAWVLTALCEYLTLHPEDGAAPTGTIALVLNGQTVRTLNFAGETEPELVVALPTGSLRPGANTLELRPEGVPGTVFYAATLRQTVAGPANGELPPVAISGVTVKREILRVLPQKVGESGWRLGAEDTKGKFQQGDRLRVRLTIEVKKAGSYVLIEDRFPSGCEISQRGTEEEVVESWGYWYDHVDVRDDRIAFFARQLPVGTHVIEYNLRAQTPGVSSALPTRVVGMYDDRLRAESNSARVEVGR